MIKNLEKKLKFLELVDEMKLIKRAIFLRDWSQESDAEHSYHLALIVMIFIEDFPELNYEKAIKLALIHDLVEIYAWDTIVFDKKAEKTKEEREKQALIKFKNEFQDILPEFIELIEEYEERISKEAKFVYSIDKIQIIIQNVMEWWNSWKKWKYGFDEVKKRQYSKIYPEFWLDNILDIYFERAEREKICYRNQFV